MIAKINEFESKYPKFAEIIRFLVVGVIATLIDMFVMSIIMYLPNKEAYGGYFNVFLNKGVSKLWLTVVATGIGFIVGLIVNYFMSIWFVYDGDNKKAKTKKGLILFALLSSIGLAIQTFGMWLFCDTLNLNEWMIKVILVIVVLIFNYITRKIFIFSNKKSVKNEIIKVDEIQNNNLVEIKAEAKNEEIKLETVEPYYQKLNSKQIGVLQIVFNVLFIVSALFYTLVIFKNINMFGDKFNIIVKYGSVFAVVLLIAFYVFLVNKDFVIHRVIFKKKNKAISKEDILTTVLSILATVGYSAFIFKFIPNKSTINILFIVFSSFSIYVLLSAFYGFFISKVVKFAKSLTKSEKIFILVSGILSFILIVVALCDSLLFIGLADGFVEIYSFDVTTIKRLNGFIDPISDFNNIRHLLFSYTTMPFTVIPYAAFQALKLSKFNGITILILNIFMIITIIILLKRLLKINNIYSEIAFYLLSYFSALILIHMVVAEKFLFSMFFTILCLYASFNKDKSKYIYFFFAVGSLSINLFLLPIVFLDKEKRPKEIFKEVVIFVVFFVFAILFTGSLSIIFNAKKEMNLLLNGYAGKGFLDNIVCYFSMFSQLFLVTRPVNHPYGIWGEEFSTTSPFFYIGIFLFIISVVSMIVHRKEKIAHYCMYWFAIIILFVAIIGWGVKLNEVFISSSSYFWAIFLTIFMLIDKCFKNKKIMLAFVSVLVLGIIIYNSIMFVELLRLARQISPSIF